MQVDDLRITKLRNYLINIINNLTTNRKFQINANMLSNDPNNYSLDKMPTETQVMKWITGTVIRKDVYSFRSRMAYSQDTLNNLKNIGFFEQFENAIKTNNEQGVRPDIENIEKIECLNPGTMIANQDGKTAEFEIQIQITYREDWNYEKNNC